MGQSLTTFQVDRMSRYTKEAAVAAFLVIGTVALAGIISSTVFQSGPGTSSTTTTGQSNNGSEEQTTVTVHMSNGTVYWISGTVTTVVTIVSTVNSSTKGSPLAGELTAGNASCSLGGGICSVVISNNSAVPLDLEGCQVQVIDSNSARNPYGGAYYTSYGTVNGTAGGSANVNGIQAESQVMATCSVPTAQLSLEAVGLSASGHFVLRLENSTGSYPSGTETNLSFYGTWS